MPRSSGKPARQSRKFRKFRQGEGGNPFVKGFSPFPPAPPFHLPETCHSGQQTGRDQHEQTSVFCASRGSPGLPGCRMLQASPRTAPKTPASPERSQAASPETITERLEDMSSSLVFFQIRNPVIQDTRSPAPANDSRKPGSSAPKHTETTQEKQEKTAWPLSAGVSRHNQAARLPQKKSPSVIVTPADACA